MDGNYYCQHFCIHIQDLGIFSNSGIPGNLPVFPAISADSCRNGRKCRDPLFLLFSAKFQNCQKYRESQIPAISAFPQILAICQKCRKCRDRWNSTISVICRKCQNCRECWNSTIPVICRKCRKCQECWNSTIPVICRKCRKVAGIAENSQILDNTPPYSISSAPCAL